VAASDGRHPSIIGSDLCHKRVKSALFGSIKRLPKKAACPDASPKSVSSWETLWLGLPAKAHLGIDDSEAMWMEISASHRRDLKVA
jgi:hypothetical protein